MTHLGPFDKTVAAIDGRSTHPKKTPNDFLHMFETLVNEARYHE